MDTAVGDTSVKKEFRIVTYFSSIFFRSEHYFSLDFSGKTVSWQTSFFLIFFRKLSDMVTCPTTAADGATPDKSISQSLITCGQRAFKRAIGAA